MFHHQVFFRFVIAGSIFVSSILNPAAFGWQASPQAHPVFRDVKLGKHGELSLTAVAITGKPLESQPVTVVYNGTVVCRSKSNQAGVVSITGLRPGLHTVQVGKTSVLCRLWKASSAPPNAISTPAIVADDSAIRGQYGPGMVGAPMMPMMAPAVLATGVTATALAVVLIGKSSSNDSDIVLPASP